MQATKKSNSVATSTFDAATGLLAIKVIGAGELSVDVRKLAGEAAYDQLTDLGRQGLGHGVNQRLMDRAAISRDQTTGASATPAEKFAAIKALADHYANGGAWKMTGDGLKPINRPALYQAVASVRGVDATKVEAAYRAKEDSVLRTLLVIKDIAAEYTRLTTRQPEKTEAADNLLKELEVEDDAEEPEEQPAEGPQGG